MVESVVEAGMADWDLALSHVHIVRLRDIVESLVPLERMQAMLLSELVGEVKGSSSPLF